MEAVVCRRPASRLSDGRPNLCEAHNRAVAAELVLFVGAELGTRALRPLYVLREMPVRDKTRRAATTVEARSGMCCSERGIP